MKVITTDTGPLIHIEEVHATRAWNIFQMVYIPDVVTDEITISKRPGNQTLRKSIFKEQITIPETYLVRLETITGYQQMTR